MADRPGNQTGEIEITPDMIEAGQEVLFSAVSPEDIQVFEASDVVIPVYEAMARAKPSSAAAI